MTGGVRLQVGSSQWLDITSGAISFKADYTILLKLRLYNASINQVLLAVESSIFEILYVSPTGKLSIYADHASGSTPVSGATTLTTGVDYYCALVRSGDDVTAYLNHASEATQTTDRTGLDSTTITLGDYQSSGTYPDIEVEWAKAWTRALNTTQLGAEESSHNVADASNIYAWWPFGVNLDSSDDGGSHDWTDHNSPTYSSSGGGASTARSVVGGSLAGPSPLFGSLIR